MKFVSWNVNGIRAVAGKGLLDIISNFNADFFCLQETKAQVDQVQEVLKGMDNVFVYANEAEKKGYSGVAIIAKKEAKSMTLGIGMEGHDDEGRIVTLEYDDFYLVNGYIPNSGDGLKRLDYRAEWDLALKNYLSELRKAKPVIMTGDFNVAHQPIDLARPQSNYNKTSGYTQVEIDGMSAILASGFTDSFRYLHPEKVLYSFWSVRFGARAKNVGWRLDYFLVDDQIKDKITGADIHNEIMGSDHCPVSVEIAL
ncbi:MAG: exodeoxyribonuclease III [Saprospiraceae bacterium]|nr:exodeoxyribonuclease III [Saprospiraceae bacterium]